MKRREVWWVNFDPSIGGEIKKKRPAVIISNDASNKFLNRVQVVPLTSKTERIYPSEAVVVFQGEERKAMADQLATVSKARLFRRAGILSQEDMGKIEEGIFVKLAAVIYIKFASEVTIRRFVKKFSPALAICRLF